MGPSFLTELLYRLRANYWFIPGCLILFAVALAWGLSAIDAYLGAQRITDLPLLISGDISDARAILTTVASSMATIAGVTFSITVVGLTLTSSQFGPRLLDNFVRDRGNQAVLGAFLAIFIYCLLILSTLSSDSNTLPALSVTTAVVMAFIGAGVLVYFIHNIAGSINAENVVDLVTRDLLETTERLFPEEIGEEPDAGSDHPSQALPPRLREDARAIRATGHGYVQSLDGATVLELAEKENAIIELAKRPGHYINEGTIIAYMWPLSKATDEHEERINAAFMLGSKRTPPQDYEHSVNQIVEVALRALSPGVNDAFTALSCVDSLGTAMCRLARRRIPSAIRLGSDGHPRVVAAPITYRGAMDSAFHQIRQNSATQPSVSIRILETLGDIAASCCTNADLEVVRDHAKMVFRDVYPRLPEPEDQLDLVGRYLRVMRLLASARDGISIRPVAP